MTSRRYARLAPFLGIACAAGALFVACANGTDGVGGGPGEDSGGGGNGDGATGNDASSFGADSGGGDSGAEDAGEDSGPSCIDDDAGCSTGNPGLCADGNHHCASDGGSVCVPLYTTQSCYTGGATTRMKGVCHDGTQSCIGTVGACEGEQVPPGTEDGGLPHEDCFNTTDDDCDGLVNQGCPLSVSLTSERTVFGGAGGSGGVSHPVHCPAGAFITRVDSIFDDGDEKAAGVSIYCATPTLAAGTLPETYVVTLAANAPAPYQTEKGSHASNDVRADDCGISGLKTIANSVGLEDVGLPNNYVEGLGHHCATSSVNFDSTSNRITFDFVRDGNTSYNDWSDSTGTFFNIGCFSSEVMVGIDIHDGSWMDNIAPICATLSVNYSAGTPDP